MQLDRREAMIVMGALAAATSVAGAARANAPRFVIDDTRYPESAAFATELPGATVMRIDGDVTRLWYDTLDGDWRMKKSAIAGLIGADAFFCLERLAMDRGLRAVHRRERDGLVSFVIARRAA